MWAGHFVFSRAEISPRSTSGYSSNPLILSLNAREYLLVEQIRYPDPVFSIKINLQYANCTDCPSNRIWKLLETRLNLLH